MPDFPFRSPWDDPNVKAALKANRRPFEISLIACPRCGNCGYYNDGSHFTCSVTGCGWSVSGDAMDRLIDNGEVSTLDDYADDEARGAEM